MSYRYWACAACVLILGAGGACSSTPASGSTGTSSGTGSGSVSGSGTETGEASCYDLSHSIVADIDETLTTADSEFIQQLLDSTYIPAEREGASELIQAYHGRGYSIVYLTARALNQESGDDAMVSAEQLTRDWLADFGFPVDENTRLEMSDTFVFGDSAAAYKTERLGELQAEGFEFEYAYGNADSDITAYGAAGIPKDATFIIGSEAGADGTVAIDGEGWVEHTAAQMPMVTDWCSRG
jgi:phosphatidate phosphatase PAH1